jgi:murein DD-endopeptidase MepM/ murein hydrolase activator NlpD
MNKRFIKNLNRNSIFSFYKIFLLSFLLFFFFNSFADTALELQTKIQERKDAIKALEEEIANTEKQIQSSRSAQNTLSNKIKIYDAEMKKNVAQIKITEQKISASKLEIQSLGFDIDNKNASIKNSMDGISASVKNTVTLESKPILFSILGYDNMTDYWASLRENQVFSASLSDLIKELKTTKEGLEKDKAKALVIKKQLENLNLELLGNKKVAESLKVEQEKLLKQTKNKESEYQKLLKNQIANKDAFEKELLDFESQLKFTIDPNSFPQMGKGILSWPLDKIKITQYFGKTSFAISNPQLYNGAGHNGVDFAVSIGTPIKVALSGVIKGFGNTDTACPGTSYGKWILVEHSNGLSTLYAHLSTFSINAVVGQEVSTGQVIGYSGNTGYSTGPHLHFTVYATQGVRIMNRKSKVCSGEYTMPIADLKAYLNPMSYL